MSSGAMGGAPEPDSRPAGPDGDPAPESAEAIPMPPVTNITSAKATHAACFFIAPPALRFLDYFRRGTDGCAETPAVVGDDLLNDVALGIKESPTLIRPSPRSNATGSCANHRPR